MNETETESPESTLEQDSSSANVTQKFTPGDHVTYIPGHAKGDVSHPDCEHGIVTSRNDRYVFVQFKLGAVSQACYPEMLVNTTQIGSARRRDNTKEAEPSIVKPSDDYLLNG